jgi:hypothetical protein
MPQPSIWAPESFPRLLLVQRCGVPAAVVDHQAQAGLRSDTAPGERETEVGARGTAPAGTGHI